MKETFSRRTLVSGAFYAAALIPALGVIGSATAAPALPQLDPNDAMAKNFAYATDTTKVDAAANPGHKPDQTCVTCSQYIAATGGCNIFPGKSVQKNGWCKAWVKKPGT
ncbi:MAG TPA: high-potential iron-sulfur protein [Steroidobacteraceae bacterium]|nr:high-potential iron-sulfur protein [Steroidobacteraceae bacterium]